MRLYKMYFITLWLFERVIILFLKMHGQVVMVITKLIAFHQYIKVSRCI